MFPDGHITDVNVIRPRKEEHKIYSTHRLAFDEYGIFFVFPILIPSFKRLFVYFMSENADGFIRIYMRNLDPHTPPRGLLLVVH